MSAPLLPHATDAALDAAAFDALVRARTSPYAYAEAPVDEPTLRALLDAAHWAPSSRNEQPWRFLLAVRGEGDAHARLLGALAPANQAWAAFAPVLGLACAVPTLAATGAPNRHAWYDTGQAVMTLALAAAARGLALHQMGGFDAAAARAAFDVPEGVEPVVAFALGTPASPDAPPEGLPPHLAERDRHRRGRHCLAELVFAGAWGTPRWPDALDGCDDEGE